MGGKGSGNRMVAKNQAWKKSPVIGDNGITATKEEISKITAHALEIALWDEIDTKTGAVKRQNAEISPVLH